MFLIDTNIFLKILLAQDKNELCKSFLTDNIRDLNMTDFSLHSIGVILFKYNKQDVYRKFIADVMPNVKLISLPVMLYDKIIDMSQSFNLDFDDAYQSVAAKYYKLKIITMDKDFKKAKDIDLLFL
jgi:predicted nucleic acid-binding protein